MPGTRQCRIHLSTQVGAELVLEVIEAGAAVSVLAETGCHDGAVLVGYTGRGREAQSFAHLSLHLLRLEILVRHGAVATHREVVVGGWVG